MTESGRDGTAVCSAYFLAQHVANHVRRLDAGQASIEPLELIREAFVIDPQQVQDRGVQIWST